MSEINDIMKNIVVLDELGVDTSGYQINSTTMSDLFYELYCNSCQASDREDFDFAEDYVIGKDMAQLTSAGRIGSFRWYALTTFYGTDIYKMNYERSGQNKIHRDTMQRGSYALGEILNRAINSSKDMHSLLREPIVLNTKDFLDVREYGFLSALQNHLENFMELPHIDIAKINGKIIEYDWKLLRDKDVIVPFVIGSQDNINKFAQIAKSICGKTKASCAVGLFITRVKPSLDGKEPKIIDPKDQIPVISESPFFTPIV